MYDDDDLRYFLNVARLFPLPDVVLFPHVLMPLHIFEPRYRQMTEDALADDQLITMVQIADTSVASLAGAPPLERVGCLGRIIGHERLPDGRFHLLLSGRKRVRIVHEIRDGSLYRKAEVELLDDIDDAGASADAATLTRLVERLPEVPPELSTLIDKGFPLAMLTDVLAHALPLTPDVKQALLAETHVARRARALVAFLEQTRARKRPGRHGNHGGSPFSVN